MRLLTFLSRAVEWQFLRGEHGALACIQLDELRRQLPLLYLLLIINVGAVAYTHYGLAPDILSLVIPGVLCTLCGGRAMYWWRSAEQRCSDVEALHSLRKIITFSSILSVCFVLWSLIIGRYGGPYEESHVAFFLAITVIGCIFCLIHLPQAALAITVVVIVPYVVFYLFSGNSVFLAIAINFLLVSAVMIQVLFNNFNAFVALEVSKAALAVEQAQTRALAHDNALLANTDALTGLPNRRAFFAELESLIARRGENQTRFAVGLIDLDGFKPVNDSFGHAVGDKVLIEVGQRLREWAVGQGFVARLGGDEFGILITDAPSAEDLVRVGHGLSERVGAPMAIDGLRLACGASCGIAASSGELDAAILYDRADYALYDVKAGSRGATTVYTPALATRRQGEQAVEASLLASDLEREMEIHFQPIVEIATGVMIAAEALARWTSPVLGPVAPDRFIEVAERTGLMRVLTPILLRKALAHAAAWPDGLRLSFNLSAHDIGSAETVLAVIATVRSGAVEPSRITLEITETAIMRDFDLACTHIAALRAIGLRVALDDFGAGYSSLSCVHRLDLDQIKIDRSFVRDILGKAECRNVLLTILDLCRRLDLGCVVEGVETAAQRDMLVALGAIQVQGYYFARPVSAADFARGLVRRDARALVA